MKQLSPYEASILAYLAQSPTLPESERKKFLARLSKHGLQVAKRILSGKEQKSASLQSLRSYGRREDAVGSLRKEDATARAIRHWIAGNSRS